MSLKKFLFIFVFLFSISCLPNLQTETLGDQSNIVNPHKFRQLNSKINNQYDISLSCDNDISDMFFESKDIDLIKYTFSNNNLYATLKSNDVLSSGCFKIKCENNSLIEENVYTYTSNNQTFVSNQCYDEAFYKALDYEIKNNLISMDDAKLKEEDFFRRRTEFQISLGDKNSSNIISKSGNVLNFVEGNITIKVIENNVEYIMPLFNICVRLYDYDPLFNIDDLLGETMTDSNGYYSFTFQNKDDWSELGGYDIQVKIYARGKTFAFYKTGTAIDAQIASERISNVATGSSNRFDICVDTSYEDNLYNNLCFGSAAGMLIAEKYAIDVIGISTSTDFFTNYMIFNIEGSFTFGNVGLIRKSDCNNWRTSIHEYTHHIQYIAGAYPHTDALNEISSELLNAMFSGSETIANVIYKYIDKFRHSYNEDFLSTKASLYGKDFVVKLAWSEAVADLMPSVLYEINYSNIQSYECFTRDIDKNLENNNSSLNSGEAVESSITRYLWDLIDGISISENDSYHISENQLFSIIFTPGLMTLDAFVNEINNINFTSKISNGSLLILQNIAPKITSISYNKQTNHFEIEFNTGGTNLSPNNRFLIQVYSIDGDLLFNTGYFDISNTSKYKYSFSDSQLIEFLNSVRGIDDVYFNALGINTSYSMFTGPYNSQYYLININDALDMLTINPSDFGFDDAYPGEETGSSIVVDGHNLTTKRLRCGYIQEEYINLSPRREGCGTAYLEIDFDKPVSKLIVDLSFWSDDERYYDEDQPSASIDYFSTSQSKYVPSLNLLTVQPPLPTDRTQQNTYLITFNEETSSIRFYAHFQQMSGYTDRNKGRISIGWMGVIYA